MASSDVDLRRRGDRLARWSKAFEHTAGTLGWFR